MVTLWAKPSFMAVMRNWPLIYLIGIWVCNTDQKKGPLKTVPRHLINLFMLTVMVVLINSTFIYELLLIV